MIPSSVPLGRTIGQALRRVAVITAAAAVIVTPRSAHAQGPGGEDLSPYSEVSLLAEITSIRPGQPFTVALRITLDPGWHTYWVNGGDAGLPLAVRESRSASGYLGQDDPVLHVGLGPHTRVDVVVTFIDGPTRILSGVTSNQTVTVDGASGGSAPLFVERHGGGRR